MSTWAAVLLACAGCFVVKLLGYVVPQHLLEGERTTKIMNFLPIALLAALVAVQTFTGDHGKLVVDARAGGLVAAAVALLLRAPFIVVVLVAAGTAALLRHYGIG